MTIRKAFVSFSVGLLLAVLAIGLLPFLVVFSFTEMSELPQFFPFLPLRKLFMEEHHSGNEPQDHD